MKQTEVEIKIRAAMKSISILILFIFLSIILLNNAESSQLSKQDSAKFTTNNTVVSPIKVDIVNFPQRNWMERNAISITAFSGIIGVILGAIIAYLSQKRIIKLQLLLQKKNDWTNNFRNICSELLSLHFNVFDKLLYDKNYKASMYNIRPEAAELRIFEDRINFNNKLLALYLDEVNPLHIKLQNSFDEIYNIYKEITKERKENYNRETVMKKIDNCSEVIKEIVKANK